VRKAQPPAFLPRAISLPTFSLTTAADPRKGKGRRGNDSRDPAGASGKMDRQQHYVNRSSALSVQADTPKGKKPHEFSEMATML
jgi:hypothetical protein